MSQFRSVQLTLSRSWGLRQALAALLCLVAPFGARAEPADPKAKSGAVATRSFVPPPAIDYRKPERQYVARREGDWTLQLERALAEDNGDLAAKASKRLGTKLEEVLRLLPATAHERLKRLPVFLMLGPGAPGGGRDNGAEYFQKTAPDFYPLLDRRWRAAIVIYSAPNYLAQTEHWAVQLLLHEFAHAWHLEQWEEKQPDILRAWEHAVSEKLYEGVKDVNGAKLDKGYAVQNQLEYFAELSCAYFWGGEYEPFDREALRRRDPEGFRMIEKMWGIADPQPPR